MLVCGYWYSQLDSTNEYFYGYRIIGQPDKFYVDPSLFSSFSINNCQTVCITQEGKSYVRGDNSYGLISGSLPTEPLLEDTEFLLKDEEGQPFKFISAVCGFNYTLYLVSSESVVTDFKLVFCYSNQRPNPLFVNIGKRTPRALFGGESTSGVIDTEGGIIVLTESVFESPTEKVEATFLPGGDKPVKLACCNLFVFALGMSGRVYESEISSEIKFEIVKELSKTTVVDISGTYNFCFAVLNDGRVFGRGDNWKCKLGLPEDIESVYKFTLIESLNKHKIVSVFTGSDHSIFKTTENKMIVCGSNRFGQLFIPLKEIVYPPEEVPKCQGFKFCVTGSAISAALFGVETPPNFSNKKIIESSVNENKEDVLKRENDQLKKKLFEKEQENSELTAQIKESENHLQKVERENSELKNKMNEELLEKKEQVKKILKRDEEISGLKEVNSQLENRFKKVEQENSVLKKKNKENENLFKKMEQENSLLKTRNKENENLFKKMEQENSELKKKIQKMKEEKSEKKEQDKKRPLPILGSNEMKNYKKGKRIGRGSTSEVYEAIQETKLAMKVLDLEMLKTRKKDEEDDDSDEDEKHQELDIEQAKKFLQESEILNELDDEHIIKTYGFFFGNEEEAPAIILEYCESNLKKRIKKLTNEERIQIIVDISSAMKKVHSKGIIHRDLKLENILLDTNNRAKLSDFGLCTFIKDEDETLSHTSMAGTMKYMSPELLQGRRDYDEKVDVYAFGVVLFLILTKGEYPDISIAEVSTGKQAPIPSSITKFSAKLIRDCWSFESKNRPSFAEICDRLKENEHKLI